jgi:hypothetical protein
MLVQDKGNIFATPNAMAACLAAISENRITVLRIMNFVSQISNIHTHRNIGNYINLPVLSRKISTMTLL